MKVDLYANGVYVPPTNAIYRNGNMMTADYSSNIDKYMPTCSNASGANLYVKNDRKIYWAAKGGDYYDIIVSSLLFVQFGMPAITADAFFEPNTIALNFAALMGVSPSRIRNVNVVRATHNRKRRDIGTDGSLNYISFEIYDDAIEFLNQTQLLNASQANLTQLTASITNQIMTGQFQQKALDMFNVSIDSCVIQQPKSNISATEIKKVGYIDVVTNATSCRAQSSCDIQPLLRVLDEDVRVSLFLILSIHAYL